MMESPISQEREIGFVFFPGALWVLGIETGPLWVLGKCSYLLSYLSNLSTFRSRSTLPPDFHFLLLFMCFYVYGLSASPQALGEQASLGLLQRAATMRGRVCLLNDHQEFF